MIRCSLVKPQKTHAQTFLLTLAHLYLLYLLPSQQSQVITEQNMPLQDKNSFQPNSVCCLLVGWVVIGFWLSLALLARHFCCFSILAISHTKFSIETGPFGN